MDIIDENGCQTEIAVSRNDENFFYRKGEMVSVPDFNEDRFKECAPGIHFFMERKDAEDYV